MDNQYLQNKNSKNLTNDQGFIDKLKESTKQQKKEKKEGEEERRKEKEKRKKERNEMKGMRGYLNVLSPFLAIVSNNAME